MRKSLLIVPVILVAAIAVLSPRLTGDNSKRKIEITPDTAKTAVMEENKPVNPVTPPPDSNSKPEGAEEKAEIPPVDPVRKEMIVEGTVETADYPNRVLTIAQELDDTSKKVDPRITVRKDALIKNGEGKVSLEAIKAGDYVIMVIDNTGQARAVEIN